MKFKVKVCGTTNVEDALLAADAGADFIGTLVEVEQSPRCVSVKTARSIVVMSSVPTVAVVLDKPLDELRPKIESIQPFAVQLHGHETPDDVAQLKSSLPCQVWKVVHLPPQGDKVVSLEEKQREIRRFEVAEARAVPGRAVNQCRHDKYFLWAINGHGRRLGGRRYAL